MGMMKQTVCNDCGKIVEYKTKKPKLCPECHELRYGNRKFYQEPKDTVKKSKGEYFLAKTLNSIFPEAQCIDGGYYSFLPSPKGYPMQLDRYYPRLHLAFEYDGKQHESDNDYFYRKEADFEYRKQCDELKEKLCQEHKITIIRIYHSDYINKDLIRKKLSQVNMLEYIKSKTKVCL